MCVANGMDTTELLRNVGLGDKVEMLPTEASDLAVSTHTHAHTHARTHTHIHIHVLAPRRTGGIAIAGEQIVCCDRDRDSDRDNGSDHVCVVWCCVVVFLKHILTKVGCNLRGRTLTKHCFLLLYCRCFLCDVALTPQAAWAVCALTGPVRGVVTVAAAPMIAKWRQGNAETGGNGEKSEDGEDDRTAGGGGGGRPSI